MRGVKAFMHVRVSWKKSDAKYDVVRIAGPF